MGTFTIDVITRRRGCVRSVTVKSAKLRPGISAVTLPELHTYNKVLEPKFCIKNK